MRKLLDGYFRYLVVILSLSAALVLNSCSDDDDDPTGPGNGGNNQANKISFTGGRYNNQTFNLTPIAGGYSVSEDISAVILAGMAGQDSLSIVVAFPGNSTGTFTWQDASSDEASSGVIISVSNDPNKWYLSDVTGSTSISAYGQVGQAITGTFSGTVYSVSDSAAVTGSFSVTRTPDGE